MAGVGIVGAEGEGPGHGLRRVLSIAALGQNGPGEHRLHKVALGPLAAAAAHFFVVQQAPGGGAVLRPGKEAQQRGPSAFQIVNAGRGQILPLGAEAHGLLPGHQVQVSGQQIVRGHVQPLGQQAAQGQRPLGAVQRLQVHGRVEVVAGVHVPLHMDGQAGNDEQILRQVHQPGLDHIPAAHHRPARQAQRPVQPAVPDHSAVALHGQAGVTGGGLAVQPLHPPGRAVAVGQGDLPAVHRAGGNAEGHNGAAAPHHIIFAGGKMPVLRFLQADVTGSLQAATGGIRPVPGAGAFVKKGAEVLHQFSM